MENSKSKTTKQYDLEDRTLEFSKRIIGICNNLPKNSVNFVLINQVMKSGTSVGANYREANETETKKDFLFRLRISKKEGKETIYWLYLIIESNPELAETITPLIKECNELVLILSAILRKLQDKK